jgi:hypothetical protein
MVILIRQDAEVNWRGFAMSEGWSRRELLSAAVLLAVAVGVSSGVVLLSKLDDEDAPTERQRTMMSAVSEHVLPTTDTPGAGKVGAGDFAIVALAHGLDGTRAPVASAAMAYGLADFRRPDGSLRYLGWLERTLDRAANGDWLGKPAAAREKLLAALDAEAFAKGADAHPWRKLKGLILTGYYTSEIGGARELNYELTPGRFDPAVPLRTGDRAYSSDWTAVDFG